MFISGRLVTGWSDVLEGLLDYENLTVSYSLKCLTQSFKKSLIVSLMEIIIIVSYVK